MRPIEQPYQHAADLHWLAFLLTGRRDLSLDLAVEVAALQRANPFFSKWMLAWSRKIVIARALSAIREELALSARGTAAEPGSFAAVPRNWVFSEDTTKFHLERALLAIDVFPRCVLLLSVFEGLSTDDMTILLDQDRDLIRKARMIGLQELTRNLACLQAPAFSTSDSPDLMRHALHA